MALMDIDKSKAEEIISERPKDGFKKIDEFFELELIKSNKKLENLDKTQFTVESKFFKLITNAYYNDMKFALTSGIQLDDEYRARVIARRFGGEVEREADPEDESSDE
jgi:general secretion pathway protein K